MKLSKSKYLNSLSITLGIEYELIERIVFKDFIVIGILEDNYLDHEIYNLAKFLLNTYLVEMLMLDDLNDFINCVRNLEIIN